tara:strand:+ start:4099 stop:4302 length:204 start_codon:yes stop_codon:yes gene_type:complete
MSRQFVNCPATEAHERHMATLKGHRTAQQRQAYIADVQRAEGKVAADWLRDDFAKWWQQQRPKETAK